MPHFFPVCLAFIRHWCLLTWSHKQTQRKRKNGVKRSFFTHALIEFVCFESTLYFITLKGFRWRSMIEGAYVGQWQVEQQTDLFLGVSGHSWERESEKTIAGTNSVHHTCVNRAREWAYVQFYSLWISNTHFHLKKKKTSSFLLQTFSGPRHLCNWLFHYILGRAGHSECSIISTPHWAHMRSSSLSQVVHFVINNAAIAKEYRENV